MIEKKQSPVEGMPVLLRTGEMGNSVQQYHALDPNAQLGSIEKFIS
jgi:hypothetical protein